MITGFIFGTVFGLFMGIVLMSLCYVSSNEDKRNNEK